MDEIETIRESLSHFFESISVEYIYGTGDISITGTAEFINSHKIENTLNKKYKIAFQRKSRIIK